ncbi:MAG: plastocyanin/azurin family copper-binding protein [Nitrososphaeraceae archaeon]
MIDPSLFIHPSIAIPATSLVIAAFVLKARKRKYYREHYAVAMAGFILTAVAIPIGLRAVLLSYARFMTWPLTLIPHLGMATISAILISVQASLGITMLMRKKSRKSSLGLYRVHSRLGKFVAAAFVIQGLLGITVLYGILHQNITTTTTQTGVVKTVAGGTKVLIVPGAGTLGDKGFSPNPINVKVGDTVTWTNSDNMEHTVTSGTGPSDTSTGKQFDSGLSGPTVLTAGKTFSHQFTKVGEFPYFCRIHPTLVGKVVVVS